MHLLNRTHAQIQRKYMPVRTRKYARVFKCKDAHSNFQTNTCIKAEKIDTSLKADFRQDTKVCYHATLVNAVSRFSSSLRSHLYMLLSLLFTRHSYISVPTSPSEFRKFFFFFSCLSPEDGAAVTVGGNLRTSSKHLRLLSSKIYNWNYLWLHVSRFRSQVSAQR